VTSFLAKERGQKSRGTTAGKRVKNIGLKGNRVLGGPENNTPDAKEDKNHPNSGANKEKGALKGWEGGKKTKKFSSKKSRRWDHEDRPDSLEEKQKGRKEKKL